MMYYNRSTKTHKGYKMNSRCAVTEDLNRYLDQLEEEESYDNFIDESVNEYMEKDAIFDPTNNENFSEALIEFSEDQFAQLNAALQENDSVKLLNLIKEGVQNYWISESIKRAKRDFKKMSDDVEPYESYYDDF